MSNDLKDIQREWAAAGRDSDLGLWWLANDIRDLMPEASEDEIRQETLGPLRPLLEHGLLRAVNLHADGTFELWEGSVDGQLARINSEWTVLGRPPTLGDIVWFIGHRGS